MKKREHALARVVCIMTTALFAVVMGCENPTQNNTGTTATTTTTTIPPQTFTVNAGTDVSTYLGITVNLEGTVNKAQDAMTYAWKVESGPEGSAAKFTDGTQAKTVFYPDKVGTYTLEFSATYGTEVNTDTMEIKVELHNSKPAVYVQPSEWLVAVNDPVMLTGFGIDANLTDLTYTWAIVSQPEGSALTIPEPTESAPYQKSNGNLIWMPYPFSTRGFTLSFAGEYVFRFTVSDGTSAVSVDTKVNAETDDPLVNAPPVAKAGNDVTLKPSSIFSFDPSGSGDIDSEATFSWTCTAAPDGVIAAEILPAIFSSSPIMSPNLALKAGTYTFTLTARDEEYTVSDSVNITVLNVPPTVSLSEYNLRTVFHTDGDIESSRTVTIRTQISDSNRDKLTTAWRVDSQPEGAGLSSVSITPTDSTNTVYAVVLPKGKYGKYAFVLDVDDGSGPVSAKLDVFAVSNEDNNTLPAIQ